MTTSDIEKMGPTRNSTNTRAPSEGGMTEKIVTKKADVALQFLAEHGRIEYNPEEERVVRWRIDLFLLPVVSQSLSHARIWVSLSNDNSPLSYRSRLDYSIWTK